MPRCLLMNIPIFDRRVSVACNKPWLTQALQLSGLPAAAKGQRPRNDDLRKEIPADASYFKGIKIIWV